MSDKRVEDMFEVEGVEGFEGFNDYEEFDEEESSELEKGDVIFLTDEQGDDHPFAVLDIIEYENGVYMVLASEEESQDDEASEVVILQGESDPEDPDSMQFESVDDEITKRSIFAVFRERNRDEFDFVEEDQD